MKDVSDNIIGCDGDKPLPVLPSLDNVCLEEKTLRSSSQCEECDTSRALPEFPNTWGDFEGFSEFTPQSEEFYYADEALQLDSSTTSTSNGGHCIEQSDTYDGWDAFNEEDDEYTQNCEEIFKLSFPVPSEEETNEDVKSLGTLLASPPNGENAVSQLLKSYIWLDGDWSEKDVLTTKPGCDWRNSKGCRNLMSMLCISAENTSVTSGGIAEDLTDGEHSQEHLHTNKSLIQTKLDVAPGCKQGHIFSYQLFLKKPSADVPMSFLPFSGKKSFFSTNQTRFNF